MIINFHECHYHGFMPAVEVENASKEFHDFIMKTVFSNSMNDSWYILKNNLKVNPFFQGGCIFERAEGWMLIEFWTKDVESVYIFFTKLISSWEEQMGRDDSFEIVYHTKDDQ